MRIHINLEDKLVKEIDEIAGRGKRSEYIAEAVRTVARRDRRVRIIEEGAGMLSDKDYPEFATPEKIAEWLADLRDTPSIRRDPLEGIPARHDYLNRVAEGPESEYGAPAEPGDERLGSGGERDIDS